jgi:phosphoribosyl-ATP pyrophosphohydrolase
MFITYDLKSLDINNREFYRTQIMDSVTRLKALGIEAVEEAVEHLEVIRDTRYRLANEELQAVYHVLLLMVESGTDVAEVYDLSRPQLVYGAGLLSAVVDCVSLEL